MERVAGIGPAAAWPFEQKAPESRFAGRSGNHAGAGTVRFEGGLVGSPPEPQKPSRLGRLIKTLALVGMGALGGYFYGASGQSPVREPVVAERPAPQVQPPAETAKRMPTIRQHQPKNPHSTAIYQAFQRPGIDLAVVESHLDEGGDLADRFGGHTLFANGMLSAARNGNEALADFLLDRATPEMLAERTSNGMNLLKRMAASTTDGGVRVFEKTLNAMKEAGIEDIAKPDVYDWHLAHSLAFFGNHGALQIVINDTETFGNPQTYLIAVTRPYDNGQEGRSHSVTPGKTPLQIAQRQLDSTVEGSNIVVDKKKQALCEGVDIPAESQEICAELDADLAGAAERIQAKRTRLEATIRLIQETLG